ncbi:MAG: TRAP transporter substrate-binding protein DctP [Planctomycetota bacterium]
MDRRRFVKNSVIASAGLVVGSSVGCTKSGGDSAAVHTQKKIRWNLASSFPKSLDVLYGAAEVMAKRVDELTDGNFQIRTYEAGKMGPALEVLDSVRKRAVDIGHTASYYYIGKHPALAFDAAVPFGLSARQQLAWTEQAGGRELIDELFADFNIMTLTGGNTGVQMGGWFRNPVNSLQDLKGLKMRIPGVGGEVMARLGVTVQVLPGGEIYLSLERGAIDATEWVGPYDDKKLGFHKVAKNYYYPGWWEPGPALSFYVNRDAWKELPSSYQAALRAASAEASLGMMSLYDAKNPAALQEVLATGVKLRAFPDDIMAAARAESAAYVNEKAAANASYRKVYEHWSKFRDESSKWFATSETAYAAFAYRQG